jgi:hypothetical protein
MSWLVAVCFPGLLMFCTVGLQRLESVLHGDRSTAADFVARLEQLPLKNFAGHTPLTRPIRLPLIEEPGLPTRLCAPVRPNPDFQPTGRTNPV